MAKRADLPVAEFEILDVPNELISANIGSQTLDLGAGECFGSRYVEASQEITVSDLILVPDKLKLQVFLFDKWVRNGDRTLTQLGGNPNLLWDANSAELTIIDHNLAFDLHFDEAEAVKSHIFRNTFNDKVLFEAHKDEIRLSFRNALSALNDIQDNIPDTWGYSYQDPDHETDYDFDYMRRTLNRINEENFWI